MELLVSVSIMVLVIAMILVNYKKFDSGVVLANLGYDIGLAIRQAQTYGISVKGNISGGMQTFTSPYGVYFNVSTPQNFILFVDSNSDGNYTSTEKVDQFNIRQPFKITKIYTINSSAVETQRSQATITFLRPNPDAKIKVDGIPSSDAVEIYIGSTSGTEVVVVTVSATGQISVKKQ